MKIVSVIMAVTAGAVGLTLLPGCVVRETRYARPAPVVYETTPPATSYGAEVEVSSAPPAPIQEEILVSPGPGYVWIGGFYAWEGRWVWHRGHYGLRPRAGAVWISPHYEMRRGRHVWIGGGWR